MRKIYFTTAILTVLVLPISIINIQAQCTPLSSSYWGEMLPNAGCGTFASYSPFGPGQYFRMPVLQGGSYSISTCGASINTQITGFQQGNNTTAIFFNDDNGPLCASSNASVTYTPTFSDYLNVNVSEYNCLPGGTASITVQVRQNNNLNITSAATDMCEGDVRNLTATPVALAITPLTGSGSPGAFSGTGVSGTTFTAPTPSGSNGVYNITYTFGYCSVSQSITVWRLPTTSNAGPDQAICTNTATLAANTPTYGTGSWSVINGPGTVTSPGSPTSTITGLVNGQTTICRWTITNGPSCQSSTDDVSIVVSSLPTTSVAGNDTNICGSSATMGGNNPATGVGTWTLVSGSGTISSPNSYNTNVTGLGVGPNTFRWTITNGSCTASYDDVVFNRLPSVTANINTSSAVSCYGDNDGSAMVTAGGGDGNYAYNWLPVGGSLATASGLSGGYYEVMVTDGNGCTASTSVTITAPQQMNVGVIATDPVCYGDSSGALDLTVTGGTFPYTYSWSNGAVTEDISMLSAGAYTVVVSDAHGCEDSNTVFVINPAQITITPTITIPECNGDMNGAIVLNVVGGNGTYSYLWDNSSTAGSLSGIGAGAYICTVTDTLGCSVQDTITVTEPGVLTISSVITDESAGFDGAIDLTVTGGTAIYTYSWNTGATWADLSNLTAGTYQVTVTDANGCSASYTAVVNASNGIDENTGLSVNIYPNPSEGVFNISLTNAKNGDVVINVFDMTGRKVKSVTGLKENNQFVTQLDLTNEKPGIYMLKLEVKGGASYTKRLVIR